MAPRRLERRNRTQTTLRIDKIKRDNMNRVQEFPTLISALSAGYQVERITPDGYIVRIKTSAGWSRAIVSCKVL